MSFREKIARFFYGRYGSDQLNNTLLCFAILLSFINIFFNNYIIYIIQTFFIVTAFVRMLSRNIYKRRNENQVFLKVWNPTKSWITLQIDRIKDRNHIYKKCNNCKAIIRLPRKKGKHTATCPKCRVKFEIHI